MRILLEVPEGYDPAIAKGEAFLGAAIGSPSPAFGDGRRNLVG
jgi:hypothetical protein